MLKNLKVILATLILAIGNVCWAAGSTEEFLGTPKDPNWIKNSVIYQVYLRAYSPEGKLYSLENDYSKLRKFGINCVLVLPVHPSGNSAAGGLGHPLEVVDFSAIDLEYGTRDGLKSLTEQARFNQIRIILTWVVDRASRENQLVQDHPEWFDSSTKTIVSSTVNFNFESTEAKNYIKNMMLKWAEEYSLDGFYLQGGENLPHDFQKMLVQEFARLHPGVVLIGGNEKTTAFHLFKDDHVYGMIFNVASGALPASNLNPILNEDSKSSAWPMPLRYLETAHHPRASQLLGPRAMPAAVLLFALEGTPLLYAGQEIGETHQPSFVSKEVIDWKAGLNKNSNLKKFYKKLIKVRSKHPSLTRGQKFIIPSQGNRSVLIFAASYREDATLIAVNFSDTKADVVLEIPSVFYSDNNKLELKSLLGQGKLLSISKESTQLILPKQGYMIWARK